MKFTCLTLFLFGALCSCVPQTRTSQLVPVVKSSANTGQPVLVRITGSRNQAPLEGLEIEAEDFKEALETSVVDSGLFAGIGGGAYELEATIVSSRQPAAVFSVTTEFVIAYTLTKGGSIVWKDTIRSSHLTSTAESSIAEFRDRMSAEGAMRENIRVAIGGMSARLQ
ncbi:hypothetical protein [Haloferula sp.]|uniref:hypothetical protein n=1 Tax=Haloferula sp. TaxID=2497595 RepID=UPI003C754DAA